MSGRLFRFLLRKTLGRGTLRDLANGPSRIPHPRFSGVGNSIYQVRLTPFTTQVRLTPSTTLPIDPPRPVIPNPALRVRDLLLFSVVKVYAGAPTGSGRFSKFAVEPGSSPLRSFSAGRITSGVRKAPFAHLLQQRRERAAVLGYRILHFGWDLGVDLPLD
jgi:hypothetical protein